MPQSSYSVPQATIAAPPPLVSIIVLGYNHRFCLDACFESIVQQEYPAIEIIYVDNASSDGSSEFVAEVFPQIRIIQNSENYGFAKGNNIGIAQAKGEYVFILNPDTVLTPHCILSLSEYSQTHPEMGICMPKLLHKEKPNEINSVGMTYNRQGRQFHIGDGESDRGQYSSPMEILIVPGASMFCRRKMLEEIAGFDESYFAYYEDAELSLKAWWHGWRCVFLPDAVVYHLRNSAAKRSDVYYQNARYFAHRNQYWPLLTFMPLAFLLHILPTLIWSELRIVVRGILSLIKYRRMPIELLAKRDAIINLHQLLRKRDALRPVKKINHRKLAELVQ